MSDEQGDAGETSVRGRAKITLGSLLTIQSVSQDTLSLFEFSHQQNMFRCLPRLCQVPKEQRNQMPIQNLILFIAWEADTERTAGESSSLQLCRHERTLTTSEHEDLIVYIDTSTDPSKEPKRVPQSLYNYEGVFYLLRVPHLTGRRRGCTKWAIIGLFPEVHSPD